MVEEKNSVSNILAHIDDVRKSISELDIKCEKTRSIIQYVDKKVSKLERIYQENKKIMSIKTFVWGGMYTGGISVGVTACNVLLHIIFNHLGIDLKGISNV